MYAWLYFSDTNTSLSIPRNGWAAQLGKTITHFQSPPVIILKQVLIVLSLLLVNILSLHPWAEILCSHPRPVQQFSPFPGTLVFVFLFIFLKKLVKTLALLVYSTYLYNQSFLRRVLNAYLLFTLPTPQLPCGMLFNSSNLFQTGQTIQQPCHTLTSALTSDTNQLTTTISPLGCWRKKKLHTMRGIFFH